MSIFISYRRNDSAYIVDRLHDKLVVSFGRHLIFWDLDSIPYGRDYGEYTIERIQASAIMLVVIGPLWSSIAGPDGFRRIDSQLDFVRKEIVAAFDYNLAVIPVLVGNAKLPLETDLPSELKKLITLQAAIVRGGSDFHKDVDRLIFEVRCILQSTKFQSNKKRVLPFGELGMF